jgi:Domain of unknown function (DUF4864)
MRSLLLAVVLVTSLLAWRAPAAEPAVSEADRAAIRLVIERQIEAFRRDDGAAAFGFAAPAIRRQFGTPEEFLRMVQRSYRPVYRPTEFSFGPLVGLEGRLVQRVTVVGPDGTPVLALYIMEQQPDGTWLINGCILAESDEKAT